MHTVAAFHSIKCNAIILQCKVNQTFQCFLLINAAVKVIINLFKTDDEIKKHQNKQTKHTKKKTKKKQ